MRIADKRKSRFADAQMFGFPKQAEAGVAVAALCRTGGFSDKTFYKWRSQFGGKGLAPLWQG